MNRVLLALLLAGAAFAARAEEDPPAGDWRDVIIESLDLYDRARQDAGRGPLPSGDTLRAALRNMDPVTVENMRSRMPPLAPYRQRLARVRTMMDDAAAASAANADAPPTVKDIVFPEPEPLSACSPVSGGSAIFQLYTWAAAAETLAAAKWVCRISIATPVCTNASEACSGINVTTRILKGELEVMKTCLENQQDATVDAVYDTQESAADFLNERIDAVTSTRASQVSVDALSATLGDVLQRLTELKATLVQGDNATLAQLGLDIDRAIAQTQQLVALASDIDDIRFRMQVTQVDIEDAQDRVADVHEQLIRLALDAATLRGNLQTIEATLVGAQSAVQTASVSARDRRLALALGDPGTVVLRYRLPVANGGELERSREVLIRAMTGYEDLGAELTAVQALLADGDNAYNQNRPLDAYDAFARAYRALLATTTGAPVLIARDSFE